MFHNFIFVFSIIFVTGILYPVYAQSSQNFTNDDLNKIFDDLSRINDLVVEHHKNDQLIFKKINELGLLIDNNNDDLDSKFNELENYITINNQHQADEFFLKLESINSTLNSHVLDSSSYDTFDSIMSDLRLQTSILITVVAALSGVVGGYYISLGREHFRRRHELEDAQTQIQIEFERINRIVCNAIRDTRNVLSDQFGNMIMINRMINRTNSVHNEFLPHLHGLKFALWDFNVPHMDQFTVDEKERLARLHNLIEEADQIFRSQHISLRDRLMILLSSPSTGGAIAQQMRDEIIIDFRERMKSYGKLYLLIQNHGVSWLELTRFSQNTGLEP